MLHVAAKLFHMFLLKYFTSLYTTGLLQAPLMSVLCQWQLLE